MNYQILDETEFDDFDTAIRENGQQWDDFELSETVTALEKGVATVEVRSPALSAPTQQETGQFSRRILQSNLGKGFV